jgi:hypothetical protein
MTLASNAITSAAIAAGALNGKGDWNTVAPDNAGITAIVNKLRPAHWPHRMNTTASEYTL